MSNRDLSKNTSAFDVTEGANLKKGGPSPLKGTVNKSGHLIKMKDEIGKGHSIRIKDQIDKHQKLLKAFNDMHSFNKKSKSRDRQQQSTFVQKSQIIVNTRAPLRQSESNEKLDSCVDPDPFEKAFKSITSADLRSPEKE